ncbi:hypothetical protein L208DRAFT_1235258, partial [Tricholoma matsutake]
PLLGAPPIPVLCSIILTSDFPLLEAEVALIVIIHEAKVHPQKKTMITTQRRIKDGICIWTGNYVLSITYDSTN